MATILLSAAGAALGGSVGGTVMGLSSVAIGRAVGATLGRVIDDRLMGQGSEPVATGKVDRFRLSGAAEGTPIPQVFGRMRLGGQVIWASDFTETATTTGGGGGKGRLSTPVVTRFSYSVSLALALCEGEIAGLARIWADGEEIAPRDLNLTIYPGTSDQLPDPVIEAVEGAGQVPAYRGTAYVVIADLNLERFGNRVPQFSFEVTRPVAPDAPDAAGDLSRGVRAVALVPGTGEYALATTPVYLSDRPGARWPANLNSPSGETDLVTSLAQLTDEIPNCGATSLVVSWFGDDLRCGVCTLKPKIERRAQDGTNMPWSVSGLPRAQAEEIEQQDGRPIYGGTPADASVIEAIRHMHAQGQRVMFYPFILMDQTAGNGLPDPWPDATDQPVLPWRGRITTSLAPGRDGTPDGTAQADAEVAAFFGAAAPAHFTIGNGVVHYTGPADDWGLRRFILHYAALSKAAGGVDAFCIGSELRALTQIRGAGHSFPAVAALRALAADVRTILGPGVKIGYAADWSEYFGYQPQDGSGNRYFHLDPLWSDPAVDFIGIDNYMPLSDWRDGDGHLDAQDWPAIHDDAYLRANIEGGEGYDWFYHSPEARAAQIRTPIADDAHGEPWVWRYKDIRNWWENRHHDRIDGQRAADPTAWVPMSKPVWFTEFGCPAIDKGTNEPNKFVDPKSSESAYPVFSDGRRDDFIQRQYVRAMLTHWADAARNPVSPLYGGPMVDMDNAYLWAWDARPFPFFPNNRGLWSDGANFLRGHWANGRAGAQGLPSVVAAICAQAGLPDPDVSGLVGVVRGYAVTDVTDARGALQPLMLAHGFDAVDRDGRLSFVMRGTPRAVTLDEDALVISDELDGRMTRAREAEAELSGRVRLRFVESEGDHAILAEEAVLPDDATHAVATSDLPLSLTRNEARQIAERWLTEARVARDTIRFALPPSLLRLGAGDVVRLPAPDASVQDFRIDRIEQGPYQIADAVRIDAGLYRGVDLPDGLPPVRAFVPPLPVQPVFLDLPLLRGDEVPHAPHIALTADPWPGAAAVYASDRDEDYALDRVITARSVVGVTETALHAAPPGRWDEGAALELHLISGALSSRPRASVLSGANLAAIGDGTPGGWEVFQFADAQIIAPDRVWLSGRLRGQAGSDGVMPGVWPAGSWVVLLDGTPEQMALSPAARRVARHYRIGPARRPYDDPAYVHEVHAFDGIGLKPFAPCHLRAQEGPGGDVAIGWIRRTRIDGDSWDLPDVPLGEETEAYLLRIVKNGAVLRAVDLAEPGWIYPAALRAADGATGAVGIEVAQVSARFGPGAFARIALTL